MLSSFLGRVGDASTQEQQAERLSRERKDERIKRRHGATDFTRQEGARLILQPHLREKIRREVA
jgi:hypothetical protein